MTVKPEQTNEHDDKQGDVRKKRDNYCRFGGLDVERRAVAPGKHPCITEPRDTLKVKRTVVYPQDGRDPNCDLISFPNGDDAEHKQE